jgi:putative sterol carrier protein
MAEIKIAEPLDLLTIAMHNILSFRKDEKYYNMVKDWNKTIVIDLKEFYPVAVIFEGEMIRFDLNVPKKFDLKITMGVDAMVDIAFGRLGPIKAVLTRKLKVKGILKIGVLLKFMKIFLNSMKLVAKNPNTNYFEVEKITK